MNAVTSPEELAIRGGRPVRESLLPYGGQTLGPDDIEAVVDVLRSDWLTTGPKVDAFEAAFAEFVDAKEAVAVSNGTAALHVAMYALGIGPGDEVIVPAITFAATANSVVFQGGTPVFADVRADTLLIDPASVEEKITDRTRAIVAVDYAGQPCRYDELRDIADANNLALIDDACHAVGGYYRGRPVGSLAELNTFSFHPVKNMTTGEGGMITTDNPEAAHRMREFRNHGITTTHHERTEKGVWFYDMFNPGFNYRLTDFQCALGMSQLKFVQEWIERRRVIAAQYDKAFADLEGVDPLTIRPDVSCAYHLYVIKLDMNRFEVNRAQIFDALRAEGIGVNVHYIPVHYHSFYRQKLGTRKGLCPIAEAAYEQILTLPIFPRMSDNDVFDVIEAMCKCHGVYKI
jgi:perosamine synthetase